MELFWFGIWFVIKSFAIFTGFSPSVCFSLFQQSSICRAAIHHGVIDNNGGLIDISRMDKLPFFVRSTKNGIESLR